MPFAPEQSTRHAGLAHDPPSPPDPKSGFFETIGATFRLGNDVLTPYLRYKRSVLNMPKEHDYTQIGYNPATDDAVRDMVEMFPGKFVQSRNPYESQWIAQGLRDEMEDWEIVRNSGGATTVTGFIASGMASPLSLIPVGSAANGAGRARRALKFFDMIEDAGGVAQNARRLAVRLTEFEKGALANPKLGKIKLKYGADSGFVVDLAKLRERAALRVRGAQTAELAGEAVQSPLSFIAGNAALGAGTATISQSIINASTQTVAEDYLGETALVGGVLTGLLSIPGATSLSRTRRSLTRVMDQLGDSPVARSGDDIVGHVAHEAGMEIANGVSTKLVGEGTMIGRLFLRTFKHTPQNRLQQSRFDEVRALGRTLTNNGLEQEGFAPTDIQSRIRATTAHGAGLSRRMTALFKSGRRLHGMKKGDWDDAVVKAALTGDESVEGVGVAAKELRKFLDDFTERSKEAGLLNGDEIGKGADKFYVPRFYDTDALALRMDEWVETVAPYLGGDKDGARRIGESIIRVGGGDLDLQARTGKTGVFQDRKLQQVPTEKLLPFIETSPEYIAEHYARKTGAQIEYARLTPGNPLDGLNLESHIKRVKDLYNQKINETSSRFGKARLRSELQTTIDDIEYVRDNHLGVATEQPYASGRHFTAPLRATSALVMLSKAGISSLVDTAAVAVHAPMHQVLKGGLAAARDVVRDWAGKQVGNRLSWELRALEYAHSDLAKSEVLIDFTGRSALRHARGLSGHVANRAMQFSGMKLVNAYAKQIASYTYGHQILTATRLKAAGRALPKKLARDLERIGVDDAMLGRFAKQAETELAVRQDGGLLVADLSKWGRSTSDEFRNAVFAGVGKAIPSPGAAEVPRVFRSEFGSMVFQFMSFLVDSNTKYLGTALGQRMFAERDFRAMLGLSTMVGMGAIVSLARNALDGRLDQIDSSDVVMEGIHQSGIGSILMEFNDSASQWTEGELDVAHLFGARTAFDKYGGAGVVPGIPGFDVITDLYNESRRQIKFVTGEDMSESDYERLFSRMPVANLPQFRPFLKYMVERSR